MENGRWLFLATFKSEICLVIGTLTTSSGCFFIAIINLQRNIGMSPSVSRERRDICISNTIPNPVARRVGDCSVRAVAKALNTDWETAFVMLASNAYAMGDVISSDAVWGATLRQEGFSRKTLPDTCPDCYNALDFCEDHPKGTYVLGFGGHVATVVDGDLYDSWDSSMEIPMFYWYRKEEEEDGIQ